MQDNVELLAPAGSFDILKAVIAAGANAVYLGGSRFGARAYANNFTEDEMLEALDYAHLRGVKIYLTVNTLLKNQELNKDLYDYLLPFYQAGLDAVLVQDIGVLDFIKEYFPGLPIHASTQMTITSKESALYLKSLGVSRAVLSRELSLDEIREIYDATQMELEVFVHGSLCYSYSGMCLFSSLIGGRSGNRGRCAQPCRLPYKVSEEAKVIKNDSFILSLKDLCGIDDINQMISSGVCSLKIEGRMKQLPYAFGVTSVYRQALDHGLVDRDKLINLGNRGGFTDFYFRNHNDRSMITFDDSSLHNGPVEEGEIGELKVKVKGHAVLKNNQPASLEVSLADTNSHIVSTVCKNPVEKAQNRPLLKADVIARLEKTGQTSFLFSDLSVDMDDDIFVPNGVLNALRRDALDELREKALEKYRREDQKEYQIIQQQIHNHTDSSARDIYIASVSFPGQLKAVLESSCISCLYLGLELYSDDFKNLKEDIDRIISCRKNVYLRLPSVLRSDAVKILEGHRDFLYHLPIEGFVVNSLDSYAFCKRLFSDFQIIGDFGLYTFNDKAVLHFKKEGISRLCAPLELNRFELSHRDNSCSEIMIYGRYPLMQAANCICKSSKGCTKEPEFLSLIDRKNADFLVLNHCSYCYNTIYNSLATSLIPVKEELKEMGFHYFRLHFTDESSEDIHTILRCLETENYYNQNSSYTYGHYKRGVE